MESKFFKQNILIVEDDIDWAETIEGYLKAENFNNIVCAHTYEDAIRELKKRTFCLAVIDLNLKNSIIDEYEDFDGFKIIEKIEQIPFQYRPSVLVITAYRSTIPKRLKDNKNIPGFFLKNLFDKKEFIKTIKGIMPSKV